MTAQVIPMPDRTRDRTLIGRAEFLRKQLVTAMMELEIGLLADDADLVAAAGRKVASVGWLFREAADRRDRGSW